ncbi:MAG: riboflavin synthase [Acidobacteria bacterium]|nr:riboflavin synthase [Acidobacteriota bacterium]
MFTGLIRHLGTLQSRQARRGGLGLRLAAPSELLDRAEPGASVCVHGACLTSVARDGTTFEVELSEETLARTRFGDMAPGTRLHLEPSLRVGDPLDGHFVMGHVDGLGRLLERPGGEGLWRFAFPPALAALLAPKGSVAVDGISLTVVEVGPDGFSVALIPETVRRTALDGLRRGDPVHLEADPIARYVERARQLQGSEERLREFARRGWEAS